MSTEPTFFAAKALRPAYVHAGATLDELPRWVRHMAGRLVSGPVSHDDVLRHRSQLCNALLVADQAWVASEFAILLAVLPTGPDGLATTGFRPMPGWEENGSLWGPGAVTEAWGIRRAAAAFRVQVLAEIGRVELEEPDAELTLAAQIDPSVDLTTTAGRLRAATLRCARRIGGEMLTLDGVALRDWLSDCAYDQLLRDHATATL
jgi:hypothetical protein